MWSEPLNPSQVGRSCQGVTSSGVPQNELLHVRLPPALGKFRTTARGQYHRRKLLHNGSESFFSGRCSCSKFRRPPSRFLRVGQHHLLDTLICLGSWRGDIGHLLRGFIEHDLGQFREEVHHGARRAAHDGTIGIRATLGHGAVCVETFAMKVRGEYRVF